MSSSAIVTMSVNAVLHLSNLPDQFMRPGIKAPSHYNLTFVCAKFTYPFTTILNKVNLKILIT